MAGLTHGRADRFVTSLSFSHCVSGEEQHPAVEPEEKHMDYLSRTEQYWIRLARSNMGPDAKEKNVVKVAHAMAKTFYEDSV